MRIRTQLWVMRQRALENTAVIHAGLVPFLAYGALHAAVGNPRRAVRALSQVHRTTRIATLRRLVEPYILKHRAVVFGAPTSASILDVTRLFGQRIMVLKEPGANGEKGVLFVMFTEMLSELFRQLDLPRLMREYTLVIEPSWSGYCDEDLLRYMQFPDEVFVAATEPADFAFLERAKSNLIPIPIGSCDWVNADVALPYLANKKEFDIVMTAHWGRWKRHHALFRMMRRARRRYTAVLIGGELDGRTAQDILDLADVYGVRDQITLYQRMPYARVMDLTCRARVSLLLSLKEGSNRAIPEAIFCNVPVIVLARIVGGASRNVVPETGLLTDEAGLEAAVERLIHSSLSPRQWGLEHISCVRTTARLNDILRQHALARGEPWTADIAVRSNSPESRYIDAADEARLRPWNEDLRRFARDGVSHAN